MTKWLRRLAKLVGAVILLYAIFLVFLTIALFFSLPTSETLAHWYLGEVVSGTAKELDTPYLRCHNTDFVRDRNLYGGAEIRDVQVEAVPGTGSSDTLRLITLTFPIDHWIVRNGEQAASVRYRPILSRCTHAN